MIHCWFNLRIKLFLSNVVEKILSLILSCLVPLGPVIVNFPGSIVTLASFGTGIGVLAWLVDAVAIYFCFLAFDLNFNFIETTIINFAPMIVGTILFIPGGLGVLEVGMTGLLLQSGIAISTATALVLFIRFMTTWSSVIAGIIALKFAKFNKI